MRLVVSGEGPTDIGSMRPGIDEHEFVPGPMLEIVDALLEDDARVGYSLLDSFRRGDDCIVYVSKSDLAAHGRSGPTLLPGVKFGRDTAFFVRNAQCLGLLAKTDGERSERTNIAVLFRDSDGTRSVPQRNWREKFDSIVRGFQLVDFNRGVPMVPRPKSEAWLICGLKAQPYAHCDALESESGNDGSPRSLKKQLAEIIQGDHGANVQAEWVRTRRVDPMQIDMPSFNAFKAELARAVGHL